MRKSFSYVGLLLALFFCGGQALQAQDAASTSSNDKGKGAEGSKWEQRMDPKRYRMDPIINTLLYDEYAPAVSTDGKTLIFQTNARDGKKWNSYRLYQVQKLGNGKWGKPEAISAINGKAGDTAVVAGPWFSYDSKMLLFSGNFDDSKGSMDLYYSTRESVDGDWSEPKSLEGAVNTSDYEGFPSISADGQRLYFMRRKAAGSGDDAAATETTTEGGEKKGSSDKVGPVFCYKMMVSKKQMDGSWGAAEELPDPINKDCDKGGRVLADGETYYFSSMRGGAKGNIRVDARDFDIFMSRLEDGGTKWSDPKAADFANHLSADLYPCIPPMDGPTTIMYFNPDMNASHDIYWTLVPPDFAPKKVLNVRGIVLDSIEYVKGKEVPVAVTLQLTNETRPTLSYDFKNDEKTGKFSTVITEGNKYKVYIEHPDYLPYTFYWDYTSEETLTNAFQRCLLVKKGCDVNITTIDGVTEAIVDAQVTVKGTDNTSVELEKKGAGKYYARINPGQVYNVTATAERYEEAVDTIDLVNAKHGDKRDKIVKLYDITTLCAFDNLNFNTAKWDLLPASKATLDKVYKFLTDYKMVHMTIEAHTDFRGSDAYNNNLSNNRAKSAYDYLIKKGIPADRLASAGFGETRPTVPNEVNGKKNDANMALNRRVEFKCKLMGR
ncbi:MAG: hypothetical protein EAZ57_06400 [Cytophagales bacterium]|nr:MAG: hypothetical protein EAZ67_07425 [Cytophagales bacterium]TAF60656.1 MAG: hypothetical protein EAZ57_06400 [Cytophagales bacterium]